MVQEVYNLESWFLESNGKKVLWDFSLITTNSLTPKRSSKVLV
jgi:hypothetical protein